MKIKLSDQKSKTFEPKGSFLEADFNEGLIHQVLVAHVNKMRSGTKAQKNRSKVRGGGAKPWSQKGSGRARAGTNSSPIWVGGGRAFAASNRDYSQKVNKKMYRASISVIFSQLLREDRLKIVESFDVKEIKAKSFLSKVAGLKVNDALVILKEFNEKVFLSARNLYSFGICEVDTLDLESLIGYKNVVITLEALEDLIDKYNVKQK